MDVVFLTSPPKLSANENRGFWNGLSRMVSTLAATAPFLSLSFSSLDSGQLHTHHTRYSIYNVFSMVAAVAEVTGKGHPTTIKYEPILLYPPHNLSPSWHCARRLMSRMSFFNVSTAILFWIVDHDWGIRTGLAPPNTGVCAGATCSGSMKRLQHSSKFHLPPLFGYRSARAESRCTAGAVFPKVRSSVAS